MALDVPLSIVGGVGFGFTVTKKGFEADEKQPFKSFAFTV